MTSRQFSIKYISLIAVAAMSIGRLGSFSSLAGNVNSTSSTNAVATTSLVSIASDGTQGNISSQTGSISADGRYVAFQSSATNLVNGDVNDEIDVFVHDRYTGMTTLVSLSTNGDQGNFNSLRADISGNGRFVAFESAANNLVDGDTNDARDVFVHDLETGETTRVSVATNGTEGDGHSTYPSISSDGRFVAFHSQASNLVSNDLNDTNDVFVYDRDTGQTSLVSVASDGAQTIDGYSGYASISADGRFVAFESSASNLVPDDTNDVVDVFVHDRQTGQTMRASTDSNGQEGNDRSFDLEISNNGSVVTFKFLSQQSGQRGYQWEIGYLH